jgi:hypothetical protein
LADEDKTRVLKLLELQRHAMLMYTSCGWFFDELSGIETVQILQFAGRAAQLAQELFGDSLEANFIQRLAAAQSNLPDQGNGAKIYDRYVVPARVDWEKLAAHYAVSALFEDFAEEKKIYCYGSRLADHQVLSAGRVRLGFGRIELTSSLTLESARFAFGVLHLGDHHVNGSIAENLDDAIYRSVLDAAAPHFHRADFAGVLRVLSRGFGESNYTLHALFHDRRRAVLDKILMSNLQDAEALYRQIYEPRAPLLRFFTELQMPLPKAFSAAAELVLNNYLRAAFSQESLEPARIRSLIETAKVEGVTLDSAPLEYTFRRALERMGARLAAEPTLPNLEALAAAANLLETLPFAVNLWRVQNAFYGILKRTDTALPKEAGDPAAGRWQRAFEDLGQKLGVKVS